MIGFTATAQDVNLQAAFARLPGRFEGFLASLQQAADEEALRQLVPFGFTSTTRRIVIAKLGGQRCSVTARTLRDTASAPTFTARRA
jgi:hypothetical protein